MAIVHLFLTLFYSIACLLLGLSVIKILFHQKILEKHFSTYPLLASAFLLGQGILTSAWIILGLSSFFKSYVIWAILIFVTLIGILISWSLFPRFKAEIKESWVQLIQLPLPWKILVFFTCILILLCGMKDIVMPPSGDAEAFYMVLPKIMAYAERLMPQSNYYEFTQIGLFGEMHYAALMSIGSPAAAKFYVWFTSLALAVLLLATCAETGIQTRGKIIALIILFTSSAVIINMTMGKVDLFGAALGLAAYYWAIKTNIKPELPAWVLTGLFTGFAMIAKFSNIPLVLPGVLVIILWNCLFFDELDNQGIKGLLTKRFFIKYSSALVVIGLCIIVAALTHLLKNQALFGEPLAPFVFFKTGGHRWAEQVWYSPETTRYILLTYPIALVFGQYPMQGGDISALLLAFIPLSLFMIRKFHPLKNRLFQVTCIAVIGIVTWMIFQPSILAPRYILATLLLLVPLAARSAEYVFEASNRYKILKVTVYLSLIFFIFISLLQHYQTPNQFKRYLTGRLQECELADPYCNGLSFINSIASSEERIYVSGYCTYFLRPELLLQLSSPEERNEVAMKNPKLRWEHLFNKGFKYLLVQKSTHASALKFFDASNSPAWLDIKQIFNDKETVIYSLSSNDPDKKQGISGK